MVQSISDKRKVLFRYELHFRDNLSLLMQSRKGMKPEAVFDFISVSRLSNERLESTLNKSLKTFQNYRDNKTRLDAITTRP